MHVRLLRGYIIGVDALALSAFEALSVGTVTDLTPGVTLTGGCTWGDTVIGPAR
jgi:hypothetical protein